MNISLKLTKKEEIEFLKDLEEKSFNINNKYFENGILAELSEREKDEYLLENIYNKEGYTALSIYMENNIIGCAVIKDLGNYNMEVALFYIDPKCQGKNIGSTVLKKVEDYFPEVNTWKLKTPTQVMKNIVFYINKCGYSIVEVIDYDKEKECGMYVFEKKK